MSRGRRVLGLVFAFIPALGWAEELPESAFAVGYAEAQTVTAPACSQKPCGECNCPACQAKKAADLKKAVAAAYAPLFYDNNFSYSTTRSTTTGTSASTSSRFRSATAGLVDLGGQYRIR